MKTFFQSAFMKVFFAIVLFFGAMFGLNSWDTIKKYDAKVEKLTFMENTMETAIPQTSVYTTIKNHFESPLAEGKTVKKAILIGYDGCRLDALTLIDDNHPSAIRRVQSQGHALIAYAGGANYPEYNVQKTKTAPGWCTELTGEWANVHGVKDNLQVKKSGVNTLMTTGVETGLFDDSAMYVSWRNHFTSNLSTYKQEKAYTEEKGLPVTWLYAEDDDGTRANVLADLNREDCSDFIFLTLEYTDHCGHSTGFNVESKKYQTAFYNAEAAADEFLDAIEARPNYDTEDWLIIMATDHGGYDTFHGASTKQERMIWIVCNKDIVASENTHG